MFWVLTLLSQILFGTQIVCSILSPTPDLPALLAFSIPVGFSVSSLLFFLFSSLLGFNPLHLILHTTALFLLSSSLFFTRRHSFTFAHPPLSDLVFLLISLLLSLYAVPPMYIPARYHIHRSFTTDFMDEFALAMSFFRGVNGGLTNPFKIRHPSCYKCHVRSRYLTALHSALLLLGHSSERACFLAPSFLMFASLCFLFLRLSHRHLHDVLTSIGSLTLFLFAGGYGFFNYFETVARADRDLDFVFNAGGRTTEWSHPLLHYLFAQRPSQLSLCLVLSAFHALSDAPGSREFAFAGLALGLLAAVQHQAFLCGVAWSAAFIALHSLTSHKRARETAADALAFGALFAAAAAFPLVHYLPRANRVPMAIRARFWQPLVDRGAFFPAAALWWEALGAFAAVALVAAWFAIERGVLRLYAPSVAVFALANRVQFQGYSRVNVVAFYPYWVSVAAIVFFAFFKAVCRRAREEEVKGAIIGIAVALFVGSVASGSLGFARLRKATVIGWSGEMEGVAQWIARNTPRKAVFISTGTQFDVVAQLAGKVSYVQSERMAWLAGFDVDGRMAEIARFVELGGATEEICTKVTYIVNTIRDGSQWPNWTKVFESGRESVFKRR